MNLTGGVALITGGAGGIGRGLVRALRARGTDVATLDRLDSADATLALRGDVTDEAAVATAVSRVQEDLGPIRSLVCAAGIVNEAAVVEMTLVDFRRVLDVSAVGTFLAVREVLPGMIERRAGSIVTFSSGYARRGYPRGAHYAAAKAAVEGFTRSVALEGAAAGVRANAVAPGPVETAMVGHVDAARRERTTELIPLGRFGEVDDVVAPVLFLLSDASRYLTGQVIQVNGGLVLS